MADETKKILLELTIDTVQSVKNLAELKKLQKEANKELEGAKIGTEEYKKLEVASGLLTKRITGLKDATKQNTKELNVQKGSARDVAAQYTALTKALRDAAPGTQVLGQSFDEAKKKAFALKTEIKDFEDQLGNNTPNVGNYGAAFKESVGGIQVFGTSLKGLFQMILTNPIGIIVGALFALFNILKQNDTIATFFTGVMTGLGVVMDQISAVISGLVLQLGAFGGEASEVGKIIKDVGTRILNNLLAPINFLIDILPAVNKALKGDFSGAAKIAGDASVRFGESILFLNDEVPKFVNNMSDAVKVGIAYEAALDAIESKQSKLNISTAQLVNQRDRLKIQAGDLAKTEEEREKIAEKAINVDKKILSQRLALLDEEIAAQTKYFNALGKGSTKKEEAEFRLNDLLVKRLEFENESLKFQEKVQNKINALIEKTNAEKEKAAEEEKKRQDKQTKDEEAFTKRSIESQDKLIQFKLDQAAKNAESIDEQLKLQLRAEDFRVQALLSNEHLLASERGFIIADSQARIENIIKTSEEKQRLEAKKTADDKRKHVDDANNAIASSTAQLAGIIQNINQANLNSDQARLEEGRAKELKAAGNNAKKQDKINQDYDNKKAALEKDAFKRQQNLQAAMALVNTFTAVTKVLAEYPKFDFGIATAIGMGLTLAAGIAQVTAIKSQKFAKGGIIGGQPHSAGGTTFQGSDGSMFEAERGELLAVVNKRDTPLLSMLSQVNSIHGKPFYKDGGLRTSNYMLDGGFAARASSDSVMSSVSQRNEIMDIVSAMPPQIVLVEDINTGQGRTSKVQSRANI